MAVAHAAVKAERIAAEAFLYIVDKNAGFPCGYLVRGMIRHDKILVASLSGKRNDIGTDGGFVIAHFYTHARRFQRRSAL